VAAAISTQPGPEADLPLALTGKVATAARMMASAVPAAAVAVADVAVAVAVVRRQVALVAVAVAVLLTAGQASAGLQAADLPVALEAFRQRTEQPDR
jgi:hypothetical protein